MMLKIGKLMLAAAVISAITPAAGAFAQDKVTLRMVWWGSDGRSQATLSAIKLFEAAHPGVHVQAEAVPFDGYMDKIFTQIAANDAPDLMQLPLEYVSQLGEGGALLNLDKVDLTNLDPATTKAANRDGQQIAVPSGLSTTVFVANKALFDGAGVALPDDKTWSWNDYANISKAITQGSKNDIYGTQALGTDVTSFESYLRQLGSPVYDAEGNILIEPAHVVSYLELTKKLVDERGSYGPELSAEVTALPLEQTPTATNKAALGLWATAQYTSIVKASGSPMVPLRLPSQTGKPGDHKMSIAVAQYWGVSSRSEHPEETQALLDFLVNNLDAGKQLLIVRGTPPNSVVRDTIAPGLSETDATVSRFISELSPEATSAPLPPPGYGSFRDIFRRYVAEYLFGRLSAQDSADQMIAELKSAVAH